MPILIARPFFYDESTRADRKQAVERTRFYPGEEDDYNEHLWALLFGESIWVPIQKSDDDSVVYPITFGSAIDGDTLVPAIEVKDGPDSGFILFMTAECYDLHRPHKCSHPECETMVQLTGYCQKCGAHICPEHLVTRELPKGHEPEDHWRKP